MTLSIWRDDANTNADTHTRTNASELPREADLVIVGGGIAGMCVARAALQRGRVPLVLEAGVLASGATGRNAGFAMTGLADHYDGLCAQYGRDTARALWTASQRNLHLLTRDVIEGERIDADVVPCGSVVAAWNEDERAHLERSLELLREDGFHVLPLEGDALRARTGSTRFLSGLYVPDDKGIHPVKLVRGLARNNTARGARILEQHAVRTIEQDAPGARVSVHTERGTVIARDVVIATNAYAPRIDPWFARCVRPVRGQALCTEPAPFELPSLVYTDDGFEYARQRPDKRIVVGGCRRAYADSEVGWDDTTTEPVQQDIERFLHEAWPAARGLAVSHRWSGVMGFSVDGIPLVGRLPHKDRVAFCVGFTGHGMGYALVVAEAVQRLLDGEPVPALFDATRIAAAG